MIAYLFNLVLTPRAPFVPATAEHCLMEVRLACLERERGNRQERRGAQALIRKRSR